MGQVWVYVIGAMLAASGVLFRSFWLSEWGPHAFILLVWVTVSVAAGWGGKGKPHSIRFGLIFGSGIALILLATLYTNLYVGAGVLIVLLYLGSKTKFLDRKDTRN